MPAEACVITVIASKCYPGTYQYTKRENEISFSTGCAFFSLTEKDQVTSPVFFLLLVTVIVCRYATVH